MTVSQRSSTGLSDPIRNNQRQFVHCGKDTGLVLIIMCERLYSVVERIAFRSVNR